MTKPRNDKLAERTKDATVLLANKTPLRKKDIDKLAATRMVGIMATGYNIVTLKLLLKKISLSAMLLLMA
ncbi:hypothetical protein AGMMS49974_00170 [Deltaproteobacteria bacterium]|nr:hypothetical protein AGMMS49974_00170 [Deltaproteobacteria bacterium]